METQKYEPLGTHNPASTMANSESVLYHSHLTHLLLPTVLEADLRYHVISPIRVSVWMFNKDFIKNIDLK